MKLIIDVVNGRINVLERDLALHTSRMDDSRVQAVRYSMRCDDIRKELAELRGELAILEEGEE